MIEFELKYQLPPGQRRAVRAFVSGRAAQRSRQIHLQAAYFDTPDRLLARNAMALRVRREGDVWVQTLKGGDGDGLARQEHNLSLADELQIDFAAPQVDPSRHAGVEIGDRLIALLKGHCGAGLGCRYRSDVRRTIRELAARHGRVELAFDEGFLEAEGRQLPLCELEIELIDGHPLAVLDVARRWALRFGLWLDVRSKAQRGDMLAGCVEMAAPQKAGKLRLDGAGSAADLLQAAVADCRIQILANGSQVASGLFDDEHVHQLRVGLRRLRTALRLFDGDVVAASIGAPIADPAAQLFRGLGSSRDRAVLAGPIAESIASAWREAGQPLRFPAWTSEPMAPTPTSLLRGKPCQQLLLDLIEVGLPTFDPAAASTRRTIAAAWRDETPVSGPASGDSRPASLLARRLSRWHRAVLRDAARFDSLDDDGRHRLRKRLKRLVYGAGFASHLFKRKPMRRFLKALKPVQARLGEFNDVVGGLAGNRGEEQLDWFAIGWLRARRQALLTEVRPLLQGLDRRRAVWKRRSKAGRR